MAYTMERTIIGAKGTIARLTPILELAREALSIPGKRAEFIGIFSVALESHADFKGAYKQTLFDDSDAERLDTLFSFMAQIDSLFNKINIAYKQLTEKVDEGDSHSLPPHDTSSHRSLSGSRTGYRESSRRANVKLPKINIQKFSGDMTAWSNWHDLFRTLIHENDSLSGIEKFQYLISFLAKDPLSIVKHLPLTGDNYQVAYDSLIERQLLNTFTENIQALQQYPHVDLWDFTLMNLFLQKLDLASRKRFELKHADVGIPTFADLKRVISDQCRALETNALTSGGQSRRDFQSQHKPQTRSMLANVDQPDESTSSSSSSSSSPSSSSCPLCKALHFVYRCPKFLRMSLNDRRNAAKQARLCFNCLGGSHMISHCQSTSTCRKCRGHHHTLLHFDRSVSSGTRPTREPEANSNSNLGTTSSSVPPRTHLDSSATAILSESSCHKTVLLATAIADIRDRFGRYHSCRVLLDTGSQASFISEPCARQLGLPRERTRLGVLGIGQSDSRTTCGMVQCHLRSRLPPNKHFTVDSIVLPKICGNLPNSTFATKEWPHLQGLQFADPSWYKSGPIDMLLGADIYSQLVSGGQIVPPPGIEAPLALNTHFGWVLLGSTSSQQLPAVTSFFASVEFPVEEILKQFWEIEQVPTIEHFSEDEKKAERLFSETHVREVDGRFRVALPFKSTTPQFSDTITQADRRLASLERRLSVQPLLSALYKDFMRDYLMSGHMSLVSSPLPDNSYFIPHHGVFKSDANAGIRVVFDASAKDYNGLSLNDTQLIGPKLQSDICSVLLHFRSHRFVFTCDVKQMYRQIVVCDEHRKFQLVRWRFTPSEPVQTYQLNTVTYGISSSPFLAIRSLHQLALEGAQTHPLASKSLQSSLYVDDLACGADTVSGAIELQQQLIDLLQKGCFELRKWSANHSELLHNLPSIHCRTHLTFDENSDAGTKVLGLQWLSSPDTFSYEVKTIDSPCSKRGILSKIARIYDPLGFLSPLILLAKRFIQHLWVLGLDWDERPPEDVCLQWQQYQTELHCLSSIEIPRYVFHPSIDSCELHAFCDASESGYASVVYTRVTDATGHICVNLLIAKSKVAPVKRLSLPRLELCAAVLQSNLVAFVLHTYKERKFDRIVAWSDSTVVLHWIRSSSHRFKSFVANRISHIQDRIPPECWRHVESQHNPADPASRGLLPAALVSCSLWWAGPPWLSSPIDSWPEDISRNIPVTNITSEYRNISLFVQTESNLAISLLQNHSSIRKVKAIIAWCFRFKHNSTQPTKARGSLSPLEIERALLFLVRSVQREAFCKEIRCLQFGNNCPKHFSKLTPFLDEEGILRVGGRLSQSDLSYVAKHPILLPKKHRLSELIIRDTHESHFHPGVNTTLHLLQQTFWILGGRRVVREQLSKCLRCFRTKPSSAIPKMGELPGPQVTQAKPFSVTGVDFAGPFQVLPRRHRGTRSVKCYLCLFVCFATKALHLELVSDLSSESFLAALRRFIARRGRCSIIYSDCGTNFSGANRELIKYAQLATETEAITWHFNPPSSPHFGGLWESGVKSVKGHLFRVIGNQLLTFEEFNTLVIQIEAVLNSRSLCTLSADPNDLSALTPGHFLTLEPLTAPPDPDLSHLATSRLSRWQLVHQSFWSRWRNEYLHTLCQRGKWHSSTGISNISVGSLALIKDGNAPPLKCYCVIALHPGTDGVPRVATVKTETGTFKRPIVKLCPLQTQ